MALLQISEPEEVNKRQRRLAAGIDLGTANSLVATVIDGQAQTIPDDQGRHLLPSVVRYTREKTAIIGCDREEAMFDDPYNTVISVKRIMGRGFADIQYCQKQFPYYGSVKVSSRLWRPPVILRWVAMIWTGLSPTGLLKRLALIMKQIWFFIAVFYAVRRR